MKAAGRAWGLPLAGKDLLESAQRRRTYAVRVAAGVILGAAFAIAWFDGRGDDELGSGRQLLVVTTLLLAWLIAVVAPVACAAAIAGEREDESLPLLQMTELGPWTIVLEKWLSRLLPSLGLVLVAAPLLALAYAFGGFEPSLLYAALALAAMTAVQATAVGICASAWSRGTIGAVGLGVVIMAAIYAIPAMLPFSATAGLGAGPHPLSPPLTFQILDEYERSSRYGSYRLLGSSLPGQSGTIAALACAYAAATAVAALVMARTAMARRIPPRAGNRLLAWFRSLDLWFERAEHARFGRRVARELPDDAPVAWRECHRRTLTSPRYLVRLMIPLGTVAMVAVTFSGGRGDACGAVDVAIVGILLLGLVVFGATAFSAERSSETLPVLLTTPMSAQDILRQKISGLRRLHAAGAGLLLLIAGIRFWLESEHTDWDWLLAIAGVVVMPALFTWSAVLTGLMVRRRARAITMALAVALGWIVGGFILALLAKYLVGSDASLPLLVALCPIALYVPNELFGLGHHKRDLLLIVYLAVNLPLWYALRRLSFRLADRLLRGSHP